MGEWKEIGLDLAKGVLSFVVMIVIGIVTFFVTVFVVVSGANLAGTSPGGDFVVLAAAVLVAAAVLAGGGATNRAVSPQAAGEPEAAYHG